MNSKDDQGNGGRSQEGFGGEGFGGEGVGESWSRADFEAALPLYVGGDLDASDGAFVEAWLARHPGDRDLADAARMAHRVLEDHGERSRSSKTPDLWPSLRDELARAGLFREGVTVAGSPSEPEGDGRSLGGARWFQRRSVAAAAAVLLTGLVGSLLVQTDALLGEAPAGPANTGPANTGPRTADAARAIDRAPAAATPASTAPATGLRSRPVLQRPSFIPLQPAGVTAKHLIDGASDVPYWQRVHDLPRAVAPLPGDPASDVQLTSDRR